MPVHIYLARKKTRLYATALLPNAKKHPSGWMLASTDEKTPVKSHWRRITARNRQLRGAKKIVASNAGALQEGKTIRPANLGLRYAL